MDEAESEAEAREAASRVMEMAAGMAEVEAVGAAQIAMDEAEAMEAASRVVEMAASPEAQKAAGSRGGTPMTMAEFLNKRRSRLLQSSLNTVGPSSPSSYSPYVPRGVSSGTRNRGTRRP
jgi:hypothetical protein